LKEIPPIATNVTIAWSVRLSICTYVSSVTLMHLAKAVGLNEMPFGRDTRVVSGNTALEIGPGPRRVTRKGDLGAGTPSSQRCRLSPNYFDRC